MHISGRWFYTREQAVIASKRQPALKRDPFAPCQLARVHIGGEAEHISQPQDRNLVHAWTLVDLDDTLPAERKPGQLGFFDLRRRYEGLDAKDDPLVTIAAMVPWESFRPKLKAALI
ncbi:MAG: hypothetical protein ACR2KT_09110, partial [Methylocella sp.]